MKFKLIVPILIILAAGIGFFLLRYSNGAMPLGSTTQVDLITPTTVEIPQSTQYLAFQIFTRTNDSAELNRNLGPAHDPATDVSAIVKAIGMTGSSTRKLAFIVGPLAFDNTDDQVRQLMRDSFALALQKDIAVGFHIDDSMFWGRQSYLNTPENIEWLDWNKTLNTGRRVDWSKTPTKIMPQLCLNSPAVKDAVKKRAAVIGEEVRRGRESLQKAGKPKLFAGVIAGWETRLGKDFATNATTGYCALTNAGYSASNPPASLDEARVQIVRDFVNFWTASLSESGVPDDKIFSHTATQAFVGSQAPDAYLRQIDFSPTRVAFGPHHHPGFSTYRDLNNLGEIQTERAKAGNPSWASAEGSALNPSEADMGSAGGSMEGYLGSLFNHGAVLVNVFGWALDKPSNPFRQAAENPNAIAAYQKFLRGETLRETAPGTGSLSERMQTKGQRLQGELPAYFAKNGMDGKAGSLYKTFQQQLDAKKFVDAEKTLDAILALIEK